VEGSVSGPPDVVYGAASAAVEHVVITLKDGGTIRVRAIPVGDQKFFAFAPGHGQRTAHWQAYDAGGHETSSGPIVLP
jgi:hypothetical protein